jgi:hypothetical protein
VIGPLRAQPIGGHGRLAQPPAFAAPGGDAEAFFAPQPLHALAVDRVPELAEADMRAPVAPPRPQAGDLAQQRPQYLVGLDGLRLVALGGTVLADELAGPALADAEAVLQQQDRSTPAGWAQKFPFANSFSAWACNA